MDKKYKVIAICGKSASGKDTVQKEMCRDKDFHKIISTTTRPRRQNEVEGVDYYYVDSQEMFNKIADGTMLEATFFDVAPNETWFYGTSVEALSKDRINVGVFNIDGIFNLRENDEIELFCVYLDAPGKIRLLRSLNREDNPNVDEIIRRYSADEKDFLGAEEDTDLKIITDGRLSLHKIVKTIKTKAFKG